MPIRTLTATVTGASPITWVLKHRINGVWQTVQGPITESATLPFISTQVDLTEADDVLDQPYKYCMWGPGCTEADAVESGVYNTICNDDTPPPNIEFEFYNNYCDTGLVSPPSSSGPTVTVPVGGDIQAAIDGLTSGGTVALTSGVYTIDSCINLDSNVVLDGGGATIRTTQAMGNMVCIGGGFFQPTGVTGTGTCNTNQLTVTNAGGLQIPGLLQLGSNSSTGPGGQIVRVVSAAGNVLTLETTLCQDFTGTPILDLAGTSPPIVRAGVENVTLEPLHNVTDLLIFRTADNCWTDGVDTLGVAGQIRSGVSVRQSYQCAVLNGTLDNAAQHGDGGRGYGINVNGCSTHILVENNTLTRFRHSILLHAGAAGAIVRGNNSSNPIHPNFVQGGPTDISFHGWTSSCLVTGNVSERIQIVDAGLPGPKNVIAFNTTTHAPPTLDGGVSDVAVIGNTCLGDLNLLQTTVMPSIAGSANTAGDPSPTRPYLYGTPAVNGAYPVASTPDPFASGECLWDRDSGGGVVFEPDVTQAQFDPAVDTCQ